MVDARQIDELGLPGKHVLQFAPSRPHRLADHRENGVVYTGTHDNDTAAAFAGAGRHWELIEQALSSRARLAIVPAQDVLGLGSEARMNVPGRATGNWSWRLGPGQLTAKLAERLRAATRDVGRLPS